MKIPTQNDNKNLQKLEEFLKNSKGKEQKKFYIEYCNALIKNVEEGKLREEDAAYNMVEMSPKNFDEWPECLEIFDAAADAELTREMSHDHATGTWDQKTADILKQREWERVIRAVEKVKNLL